MAFQTLCLLVPALGCALVLSGCREKEEPGHSMSRSELKTLIETTSRIESLTSALEVEFGEQGYRFMVAFSSGGRDSELVEALSAGPSSLFVYGSKTFDEAIELDREIRRFVEDHELAGLKVLYEVPTQFDRGSPVMYQASRLAESAEFWAEIEKRELDAGRMRERE